MNNVFFETQNSLMSFNNKEADKWLVLLEESRDEFYKNQAAKEMAEKVRKIFDLESQVREQKHKFSCDLMDNLRNGYINQNEYQILKSLFV
jgi:predicted esterase YcpF (UPF0227 family)